MTKSFVILGLIYALFATPAYAYLDPITGSFLVQALIGGFAAALVAIRRVREKILSLLGLGRTVDDDTDTADQTESR